METQNRPIRVLHVVGALDPGGVETWLVNLLRRIDRSRFKLDFATHTVQPSFFDQEVHALGSSVLRCPFPRSPWRYIPNFLRILSQSGPYDVVHSHVQHFSAIPLMLARYKGVPLRIAHSHIDTPQEDRTAGMLRQCYLRASARLIKSFATAGLACSGKAATALFGEQWTNHSRFQILHCGIDTEPFSRAVDPRKVRAELGIPEHAVVAGHVGRFFKQKNHGFLLEAFAEASKRDPRLFLLLVGEGPLRKEAEQKAAELKVKDRILFAGLRSDVPALMSGAMDLFVLPSHYEGLPLVVLEAQAAGLPCIVSEAVTDESNVIPELFQKLPLTRTEPWAEAMSRSANKRMNSTDAIGALEKASLTLSASLRALTRCYSS